MHQALAVQIGERVEQRRQQVAGFIRSERTLWNDLPEVLVGWLHYDVSHGRAVDLRPPTFKNPDQIGMKKLGCGAPAFGQPVGLGTAGRDQLDSSLSAERSRSFGEKNRGPVRSAEPLMKRKSPRDNAAFPGFPLRSFRHRGSPANFTFYAIPPNLPCQEGIKCAPFAGSPQESPNRVRRQPAMPAAHINGSCS